MATITDERLAEMLADVEMTINASSLAGGDAYDIYPIEFQRALTELQSLRSQAGASEAVAWRGDSNDDDEILKFTAIARVAEIWGEQGLEVTPLYSRPPSIEVTEEMVESLARNIAADELNLGGDAKGVRNNAANSVWMEYAHISRQYLRAALQGETK